MAASCSSVQQQHSNLFTQYPVVELTLSFLCWKDLSRVARVCRLWRDVVYKLQGKRQTVSFTVLKAEMDDNSAIGHTLGNDTVKFFECLYTQPNTVFMFCCNNLLAESIPYHKRSGLCATCLGRQQLATRVCASGPESMSYEQLVRSLLPPNCTLIGIEAAGIVGTSEDLKNIEEIEQEMAVSFLCLPKYNSKDRLEISSFVPTDPSDSPDVYREVQNHVHEQEIKATFLFYAHFHGALNFGYNLLGKYPTAAVAGAYVEHIITNCGSDGGFDDYEDKDYLSRMHVSLYGNNVKVTAIIIPEAVSDPGAVAEHIIKLKNANLPEKNSFAFMFACLGRGEGLYGDVNIESAIFKKNFPNTPLVGLFGNGEIGCDFFNSVIKDSEKGSKGKKRKKDLPNLYHSYTTVFVLVAIT